jgi:DNA-binding transcriptional ArsR family regulator
MTSTKTSQNAAADVFTAIAHPVRRQILDTLAQGDRTVSSLSAPFDVSRPAISQHLAILLDSGLVTMEKRGRENYYRLRPENLSEVHRWISHFERLWTQKLDTLETYLDQQEEQPPRQDEA